MHLLSMLVSLLMSIHLCASPSDSQTYNSAFNFTTRDSLAIHKSDSPSDNNAAENGNLEVSGSAEFENVGSIGCDNCVASGSDVDFFSGSGSQPSVSGSEIVNVQREHFHSIQTEECKYGGCISGSGNNAESEVSLGSVLTPVDCKGDDCAESGSGYVECGDGDCGMPWDWKDEETASVYEKNGCGYSGGLVQWRCYYRSNGEVSYCYNISRCDTAALPADNVCHYTVDCFLYNKCEYDKWRGGEDVCYMEIAFQLGGSYSVCEYRHGIMRMPQCSEHPALEYCKYTQPSTNRLGQGCIYSGECRDAGCGKDEVTDASVYETNNCGQSGGLVQWGCYYKSNGEVSYCNNISKCDTESLPGRQVCDDTGECVYVNEVDFTVLYYWCVYGLVGEVDPGNVCFLATALQQGDRYRWCEYRHSIIMKPQCSDYPALEYCRYTQPSTNRLGAGCIYSGECRDMDCGEDEVTDAIVYEKNGCGHSSGLVQWRCDYYSYGMKYCYTLSRCDTAALPGRRVCDSLGVDCVYVDETVFEALYYWCLPGYHYRDEVCSLATAYHQGDGYRMCHYRNGINTEAHCSDYPALEYCRYTQPSTNRLGAGCIYSGECRDMDCGEDEVTDTSVYENNDCGHSGGLVQWGCYYESNGEVSDCHNISQCDTEVLPGRQVCDWLGYCDYVNEADFTALYYFCSYRSWRGDECYLMTALQHGDRYTLCNYLAGINTPSDCHEHSASEYCIYTQPSTNRLTHTIIPVTVYITGLVLNHLILLVLAWKAEATVTNCLLKLLAVWDSLYLVCQLVEWAVWMQTIDVSSVIKDVGYAWVDTGCYLQTYHYQTEYERKPYIQRQEYCSMSGRWLAVDINVSVRDYLREDYDYYLLFLPHMYYVAMYWLHTAARLFQLMSVYQTVIIACFRYIAIDFPFQADRYLTYTTAWMATLGCLAVAGLLHVPSIIGGVALHTATGCCYKRQRMRRAPYSDPYEECIHCLIDIVNNSLYSTSYKSFMTFFHIYHVIFYHIVMFFALPFVILLVLNTLMLRELWRGSQTQENIAVTRVVVAIISVFMISYMIKPFYIIDVFYFDGSLINSIAHSSCGLYFTMSVLIIVLPCLNSSVNFLIYVGFRQSFRRQFVSMFAWCKRKCCCPCDEQAVVEEMELQRRR